MAYYATRDLEKNQARRGGNAAGDEGEKQWYSLHPQVFYCGCLPSQCLDFLYVAVYGCLVAFGIIWRNDCSSILTLPYFVMTFGSIFVVLTLVAILFRVPKFGFFTGKRDHSYVCARVITTLDMTGWLGSAVWGGIILFPNLVKQFSSQNDDNDDSSYYCKQHVYVSAFSLTVASILFLIIATVAISIQCCMKKSRDEEAADAGGRRTRVVNYHSTY